jgi:histidine triad (HIT) family protein
MYSHAPENYDCPFCRVVNKNTDDDIYTQEDDVIYRDNHVTAFVSSHWLSNNPGHVIVVPNRHIENIYDLTPDIAVYVHELSRQVSIAFKQLYGAEGTSTRQHNEPAGYQEVFHYHLHVFPRYAHDYLYDLSFQRRLAAPEERRPYAEKLKRYFDGKRIAITL